MTSTAAGVNYDQDDNEDDNDNYNACHDNGRIDYGNNNDNNIFKVYWAREANKTEHGTL